MAKEKEVANVDEFLNMADTPDTEDDLILDMESVAELKFEALPAGSYNARVDDVEFKRSAKNNHPMLAIKFVLTDEEFKGRKLFTNLVLNNEFGLGRLKNYLLRLLPEINMKQFNVRTDGNQLIGCDCILKVKQKMYEGEWTNDVKDVLAPASGTANFI